MRARRELKRPQCGVFPDAFGVGTPRQFCLQNCIATLSGTMPRQTAGFFHARVVIGVVIEKLFRLLLLESAMEKSSFCRANMV